jgi:hypothetical protein
MMFLRILDSSLLRPEFMFLSGNWLAFDWGWVDVTTGTIRILVGNDSEKHRQHFASLEGREIFFDKIVYHIGSFIEHGVSYEEFHLLTYFPTDRAHSDYTVTEKVLLSEYGIRGELKPCYITRNTYVVRSSNSIFIDASLTASAFQLAHQAKLDKVVHASQSYDPIYVEDGRTIGFTNPA